MVRLIGIVFTCTNFNIFSYNRLAFLASFLYYFYEEMTVMKKWLSKNVLKSCKKKIKKVKDFF